MMTSRVFCMLGKLFKVLNNLNIQKMMTMGFSTYHVGKVEQ